ncbi:DUF3995 domain-containing protein [Acanthopleuribacter pedis]|uniref:DUF3995 domain-containing protein n=1 Tax=Acanthopleuribacter pedis TaxID=442870 RepID=A0A8J7Q8V9_9BACT|nr:DUF3995 domain-containing protein [Acanthopleuribacter pedis]MBO1320701.1 DUF3995 domain-containing protein [Acanthopleuribacter pedis]
MLLFPMILVLVALFTFWLHTFVGHRLVLEPVFAAPLSRLARGTTAAGWHFITYFLALNVIAGAFAARPDSDPNLLLALALFNLPFGALFLGVSLFHFRSFTKLPQSSLLGTIGILGIVAYVWPVTLSAKWGFALPLALVLLIIALIHVAWAQGSSWPAANSDDLLELVVGQKRGQAFPGRAATLAVAGLLAAAAVLTLLAARLGTDAPWVAGLTWLMAAVFALRGFAGFFETRLRPATRDLPYHHWNRVLYSPLCLLMAASAVAVVW